jgi:hypothetical protein
VAKAQRLLRGRRRRQAVAGGNGWLLGTMAGNAGAASERDAIKKHLNNKVSETAGAANFTDGYSDGAHLLLASDRRADAVILESLIQERRARTT